MDRVCLLLTPASASVIVKVCNRTGITLLCNAHNACGNIAANPSFIDVCSLQFHNCHENATCRPNITGFCVCDPGFVGDGSLSCDHICDTNYSRCHANATCQLDTRMEVVCTCLPGFTGDGHTCTVVDECQLECPGDSEHCVAGDVEYCSCDTGSVLLEGLCVQSESNCQVCLYHCVSGDGNNTNFACKFNTP